MARGLAVGEEDMAHGAGFRRTLAFPEHRPLGLDRLVIGQDDLADCVDGLEAGLEAAPPAGHALLVVVEKAVRNLADSGIVLAQLLRRPGKRNRRRGLDRVVLDRLDNAQLQRLAGRYARSPLTIMSSAGLRPARRGRRWVPVAPGMVPRLTSGRPSRAFGPAIR